MNKVLFRLAPGFRIGNYVLHERVGSGWTAEAYLAREVPTGAQRVVKLYAMHKDGETIKKVRDFEHFCWFTEQISHLEVLPRYYHMGHVFLKQEDGIGNFYMVQEYLKGKPFRARSCSELRITAFMEKVQQVHELGYALGDWSAENLLITAKGIRMVDCDYGKHDKPNSSAKADLKALALLFKKAPQQEPNKVARGKRVA